MYVSRQECPLHLCNPFLKYSDYRKFIVLTHAFITITVRVPQSQIFQARKLSADFLKRFDVNQLKAAVNEDLWKTPE